MAITIAIDGICAPNPGGQAVWAWLALVDGDTPLAQDAGELGAGPGMTSTIADYHALWHALETAQQLDWMECTIVSDNRVLVEQLNGTWEVKSPPLIALNERVMPLLLELDGTLIHVPCVPDAVRRLSRATLEAVRRRTSLPLVTVHAGERHATSHVERTEEVR